MKCNINFQSLAFDKVLPYDGAVECLLKKDDKYFLRLKAPDAKEVVFRYEEIDHPCVKDADGIWSCEYTPRTAMNYVQLGVSSHKLGNEFFANVLLPTKNVTSENVIETIRGTHWDMSAYDY